MSGTSFGSGCNSPQPFESLSVATVTGKDVTRKVN
jgi:hypothetical protein